MRFINTSNGYIEFVEQINDSIVNSSCFPIGSVYCRLTNGTKLTFFLGYSNEPYKKQVFDLDFPISLNGEFYRNYADIQEVLGELFGEPNKELKEKVEEIESNLNVALTNLENNTEDIETLQGQMERKADLSEVYTQERVDLLLNLKVDNSTLQNQYYDKNATDAKLALKSDKADTYNKTEVDNLLSQKANTDDIDLLETQIDSINDNLILKANKEDVYTKAQTDNLLADKADIDSVYNKSEVDIKLDEKADKLVSYTKDEVNDLLDEKANYETIQGIEGSINNINDALSNHQSQLDNKADKEWTETEISSLWSSNSNHQVQLDSKANASEVYSKSETEELLSGKANTSDLDNYYTKSEIDEMIDVDPTPTPTGETETMVTFYYTDGAEGDYIEYTQLKGVAPYTITKQAVMDCLDEAIAKEGIARMVTKIELSDGVHRIDNEAFSGFTSLKEVQYGANLREMGSSAFTHCTSLKNLVIPDSVTGETDFTFTECSNATTCYVGTGITTLGGDTFCDCPKLTSCHIPSNVTNLGGEHGGVFARCYALTSVTIDGQIDHIGSNTFMLTDNLTELWLTGCTNVPLVESDTFVLSDPSNVTVHIPCDMTDAYQITPFWDIFTDHYFEEGDCDEPTGTLCMTLSSDVADTNIYQNDGETIKEALDRYLGDTFGYDDFDAQHCNEFKSSITHVAFSNNITQIESTNVGLFGYGTDEGYGQYDGGWNNIVSVTLPSNLQTIDNYAFQIMPKVSQWNIPSTVTSIGNAAFERRTQDPNVNRTIRFNRIQHPTLGNNVFDIVDEEEMMVSADTNQRIEAPTDCEFGNEYYDYFSEKGGTYEEYLNNGVFVADECDEPTEGKLIMTLYKGAPNDEGTVAYEVYQNDGETIKQALYRFLTDRFDDDTSIKNFKSSITHIVFDNSVTEISGEYMFSYSKVSNLHDAHWRNVESVTLPNNLETIGSKTFADMPKVSYWNIPSTVQRVSSLAFLRVNTNPNVFREIRFNTYGCDPPTFELYNRWSVFDIENEETIDVDTNQKITCERNEECREEFSEHFNHLGGNYAEYVTNGVLQPDECH